MAVTVSAIVTLMSNPVCVNSGLLLHCLPNWIASTYNLGSIFILALCASVNMSLQFLHIGYRPLYRTIYTYFVTL